MGIVIDAASEATRLDIVCREGESSLKYGTSLASRL